MRRQYHKDDPTPRTCPYCLEQVQPHKTDRGIGWIKSLKWHLDACKVRQAIDALDPKANRF